MQDPYTTSASSSAATPSGATPSAATRPVAARSAAAPARASDDPSASPALLVSRGLGRQFGQQQAVTGLTFTASRGEVIGLLGPNGAGKTTSLRMLAGTLAATQGQLELEGEAFDGRASQRQLNRLKRRIGYLPEGAPLWPQLTVRESLECVAGLHGLSREVRNDRLAALMDRLDITPFANQLCAVLSKGYRRRVALAMALTHDPDILLLDEPTDGLDPLQKDSVRAFIRELGRERLIIVSTHLLEEVPRICDRVLVMANGQLGFDDTPEALAATSVSEGILGGSRSRYGAGYGASSSLPVWRVTLSRALSERELASVSRLPGVAAITPVKPGDAMARDKSPLVVSTGAVLRLAGRLHQDPRPALARWCSYMEIRLDECVHERGDIEVAFRQLVTRMAEQPSPLPMRKQTPRADQEVSS
ncbi:MULTISPECIES: ABC transporter ATP-binding protein [Cobetia]|uniref:ABC transporter ATP-binding protein n=2 Tax=Halomonadaceae TaxID=28256 RepID=UPI00156222FC|nr:MULTISPECIES: ABC transporter ATP-binding protein [Cobetia]WOI27045.1 ABC transporter ATP-binding protein [Cobetia amphilecti]